VLFKTGIVTKRKAIAAIPMPSIFIVLVDITDLEQLCYDLLLNCVIKLVSFGKGNLLFNSNRQEKLSKN
jgi:hypothetical protein